MSISHTYYKKKNQEHKVTVDSHNPRIYIEEVKCNGCKQWFHADEIIEAGEKIYCEDCHAHNECPSCGLAEHTWRTSCGDLQCDNCGYAEEEE